MNVNLRRGLLESAAVAAICTGLVVVLFWRADSSSNVSDVGLVAVSTGLLGFLAGAFRPAPVRRKK